MKWLLIIASWLVSLLVSGGGLLLASSFFGSSYDSDRAPGVIIAVLSVLWLALPAGGTYLLLRTERTGWGIALLVAGILGVALIGLIGGAISAAAQP